MINFNPSEFNRVFKLASNKAASYVRFNGFDGKPKPYGWVAQATLQEPGFADLARRYENADLVVQVQPGGFIQIIRDTGGYAQEWHSWQDGQRFSERQGLNKAQLKPGTEILKNQPLELPWQKRQREAAEQRAAIVALRNNVRSTLGM